MRSLLGAERWARDFLRSLANKTFQYPQQRGALSQGGALGQKGADLSLEAGEETIVSVGDEEELCLVGCMRSTGSPLR